MKLGYILIFLICVIIILGGVNYWLHKGIKKINYENEEINIEFKIFLEKGTYKVNESINLSGYIKNTGNKDIVIPKPIYSRNIMLLLTHSNGTTIQPATSYNPPIANNITLRPNETIDMIPSNIDIGGSVMCSWIELGGRLPSGIYLVKAEYWIPPYLSIPIENIKRYNSNILMLEVFNKTSLVFSISIEKNVFQRNESINVSLSLINNGNETVESTVLAEQCSVFFRLFNSTNVEIHESPISTFMRGSTQLKPGESLVETWDIEPRFGIILKGFNQTTNCSDGESFDWVPGEYRLKSIYRNYHLGNGQPVGEIHKEYESNELTFTII